LPQVSPLLRIHSIKFALNVVDEVHAARNPTSKAAEALWALRKWHAICLIGTSAQVCFSSSGRLLLIINGFTPQNSLLDLYVIFRFLGVTFEGVNDLATYKRKICKIASPNDQRIYNVHLFVNLRRLGINEVSYLQTIQDSFVIRREENDLETGNPLVELPKRTDTVVSVTLTRDERMLYDCATEMGDSTLETITRRRQGNLV